MSSTHVCDYCGEAIDGERERAWVCALGGWGRFDARDYHSEPCLAIINDIIGEASGARPLSAREVKDAEESERMRVLKEQEERWRSLSLPQREHMVIELLAEDRLKVPAIVEKVQARLGKDAVCYGDVYSVVRRLLFSGELDRAVRDVVGRRKRYEYFRRTTLSGPIVELEQTFNHGADDGTVSA